MTYRNSTDSAQLRWVMLLLATTVVLPTVCLLWFMLQAVRNERLAVRQKLIEVQQKRLELCGEKLNEFWRQTVEPMRPIPPQDLYAWVKGRTTGDAADFAGCVVYGADGKPIAGPETGDKKSAPDLLAARAANLYPAKDSFSDWPAEAIRKLDWPMPFYGLRIETQGYTVLLLLNWDQLAKKLERSLSGWDDPVELRVYDNFGDFVFGSENPRGVLFAGAAWVGAMRGWKVELYPGGEDFLETAARRQTTLYVWAGILVIVLILAAGGICIRVVGRQMQLNRLKNDFIATVTHELKTPLASMRVLVDTLLEGRCEHPQQATEYLQLIAGENARLSRLIHHFLTFSRMERNKHAFSIEPCPPAEIAQAAVDAVSATFNNGRNILHVSVADNLPFVSADKDAMATVLINLLDNAYKYSYDDKRIELNVFRDDKFVCFTVKDNGVGMTRRQIRKIFDRFYQADTSLARRVGGAGLGLSIVKFIVEAHKGKIAVESRPDKGSEFKIKLPI